MKKRKLNFVNKSIRVMLLFIPFLFSLLRRSIDVMDNNLQKLSAKLLDKCKLSDYEKLKPEEMYEML